MLFLPYDAASYMSPLCVLQCYDLHLSVLKIKQCKLKTISEETIFLLTNVSYSDLLKYLITCTICSQLLTVVICYSNSSDYLQQLSIMYCYHLHISHTQDTLTAFFHVVKRPLFLHYLAADNFSEKYFKYLQRVNYFSSI